ncbi:tropomyosin alpha-3 chain-like [Octodon degus]|uniref:Tropomyosin alpha-3 chain-like n=1 Tax=Octodon degus TaxID=10160 RepID=A0A6P6DTJ2_OCTDE|nr:tropomyosin alpha-3 chain-like [Octodon degus]
MEAIRRKMQALKLDRDGAVERAEQAEAARKAAEGRCGQVEEELAHLHRQLQGAEDEVDQHLEDLKEARARLALAEKKAADVSMRLAGSK